MVIPPPQENIKGVDDVETVEGREAFGEKLRDVLGKTAKVLSIVGALGIASETHAQPNSEMMNQNFARIQQCYEGGQSLDPIIEDLRRLTELVREQQDLVLQILQNFHATNDTRFQVLHDSVTEEARPLREERADVKIQLLNLANTCRNTLRELELLTDYVSVYGIGVLEQFSHLGQTVDGIRDNIDSIRADIIEAIDESNRSLVE